MENKLFATIVISALLGGLVGFWWGGGSAYSYMQNGGTEMVRAGQMMRSSAGMMQEKGKKYNDREMMDEGEDMMEGATMMENTGDSMMSSSGMMRMMGR